MSSFKDYLPAPPPNLPIPRFMLKKKEPAAPLVQHGHCEYGISCIKDHMGRAHLYINEAIRFSSSGEITPDARQKIRQSRAELQCEDDFSAAMEAPAEIRAEVLKLLAACRSTWKAMDHCGIDTSSGTVDDLNELQVAIKTLWDTSYKIEEIYKSLKLEVKDG